MYVRFCVPEVLIIGRYTSGEHAFADIVLCNLVVSILLSLPFGHCCSFGGIRPLGNKPFHYHPEIERPSERSASRSWRHECWRIRLWHLLGALLERQCPFSRWPPQSRTKTLRKEMLQMLHARDGNGEGRLSRLTRLHYFIDVVNVKFGKGFRGW